MIILKPELLGRLRGIHSALDDALGDSDIEYLMDDEELRDAHPVQLGRVSFGRDHSGNGLARISDMDIERTIGHRLKARREELRISQTDLATAAQVAQARISEFESGTRALSHAVMGRICKALGISPATLFDGITVTHTMTESERDAKCRELVTAASSNVFAQAGLMIALGCVAGCKPASKSVAVDLVAGYATEYNLTSNKLAPILEFIKSEA